MGEEKDGQSVDMQEYFNAFDQKDGETFTISVNLNGKDFPFTFKKSALAFDIFQEEQKEDADTATRNALLSTAVRPDGPTLQKLFKQDFTLPTVLSGPYAEAIGLHRKSFLKK